MLLLQLSPDSKKKDPSCILVNRWLALFCGSSSVFLDLGSGIGRSTRVLPWLGGVQNGAIATASTPTSSTLARNLDVSENCGKAYTSRTQLIHDSQEMLNASNTNASGSRFQGKPRFNLVIQPICKKVNILHSTQVLYISIYYCGFSSNSVFS